MREVKYTWRVSADDETQAFLKMRALTMLGDKLGAKDIELLAKSASLPYFVSCASLEADRKQIIPPLSIQEEKLILLWRKVIQVIQKILPFLRPKTEIKYNGQTKSL